MKKSFIKIISLVCFFAFSTICLNQSAEANSDPAGICPDGKNHCAKSKDGEKIWHKGNAVVKEVQ
jgi:hypothetical protein